MAVHGPKIRQAHWYRCISSTTRVTRIAYAKILRKTRTTAKCFKCFCVTISVLRFAFDIMDKNENCGQRHANALRTCTLTSKTFMIAANFEIPIHLNHRCVCVSVAVSENSKILYQDYLQPYRCVCSAMWEMMRKSESYSSRAKCQRTAMPHNAIRNTRYTFQRRERLFLARVRRDIESASMWTYWRFHSAE